MNIFTDCGLDISRENIEKFDLYKDLLKEWNQKINLTAITDDQEIWEKHFLDSSMSLKFDLIKSGDSVIDIGTGAGFPGLPIKIMKDDINLTLLDSLNKRINFLMHVSDELNLENIEFVHGRAEDFGKDDDFRQSYDIAVSRAVSALPVLLEFCLPFVKLGGKFISYKGPGYKEEIESAKKALEVLGGAVKDVLEFELPDGSERYLVVIEKVSETPDKYPRRAGKVTKKPIV
ncbi:MAG: 16S rRNA (guanine(527)-N(7))-methyltransferase RsmG [Firmicutes bacterium]|jgi:16S rRNA (guanine527-N7)-methyltransferase|nr:16S rRNA (guanine(527)-N(7))-methyltransferase RsmG [Bacillota bacterium]